MEKINFGALVKNKHIVRLLVILLIGILLLSFGKAKPKPMQTESEALPTEQPYAETERRLESILSKIKGVGSVEVMITYDGTGKRDFVTEISREQTREPDKSSSTESTSVVVPEDAPILAREEYPKVRGVIAVCEGGSSASVREQVILAIKAVLAVEEHRIGVFAK